MYEYQLCASYPKVSLGLGFKNPTKEDSYLKLATPSVLIPIKESVSLFHPNSLKLFVHE